MGRAPKDFDPAAAYALMVRMRLVEQALCTAWADGLVPGEYHSGVGEEAVNAGVILHLSGRDTLALDHRNTSPLIARGSDPEALMLEVLGSDRGMNNGQAGHMHLNDPEVHAVADGIVGAAGPLAVGSAIANRRLFPGRVAVAMHGEGATNQGMLLEAYNLAAVWALPVIFVCKDNRWSITTRSTEVTAGSVTTRARAFGLAVESVDGARVESVHAAAGRLIRRARAGRGPGLLHARCHRPGGHFEGDPLVRLLHHPRRQAAAWGPGVQAAATEPAGGTTRDRAEALRVLSRRGAHAALDWAVQSRKDPVRRGRRLVGARTAERIEATQRAEIEPAIERARTAVADRAVFGTGDGDPR